VPNDALCTVAILLNPDNQGTMFIIMSNKNDQKRAHEDQATCPIQELFNKATADFTNVLYVTKNPAKQNLIEGHESFDPNDVSILATVAVILLATLLASFQSHSQCIVY
jgi:hypothetical protein